MELMIGIVLILLCLTIGLFVGLMKYRAKYNDSLEDADKLLTEIGDHRKRLSKRVDRLLRQKVRSCQAPLYVTGEKVRVVNHRTNPDTIETGTVHRIDATFTREHATDTIKSSYLYSVSLDRRGANDAIIRILTEEPRPLYENGEKPVAMTSHGQKVSADPDGIYRPFKTKSDPMPDHTTAGM